MRSNISKKEPNASELSNGEIGVNYNDEIIYVKKDNGLAIFSSDNKVINKIKTELNISEGFKFPSGGSDG